jgi:uncharacterized damage-inducible protein DinB
MFTSIEHFKGSWQYEMESTSKIIGALTDATLRQSVDKDHRTLGRIAWHLAQTIPEMAGRTGLKIEGPGQDETVPTSAQAIKSAYDKAAGSLLEQVAKCWTDESLGIEDNMYGEIWKRGMTLAALINHQIHHRGQMTVLMRQAGLSVPGVYGPSKEEWAQYKMPAPEI